MGRATVLRLFEFDDDGYGNRDKKMRGKTVLVVGIGVVFHAEHA